MTSINPAIHAINAGDNNSGFKILRLFLRKCRKLKELVEMLQIQNQPGEIAGYRPIYDISNLAIAGRNGTEKIQETWHSRLWVE